MHLRILILGAAALSGAWYPLSAHAAVQAGATAQSAPVEASILTLDKAIELALSTNPELRVVAHAIGVAEGARVQAGLFRNPELSMVREGRQRANSSQTIQLSQPLELGGKRSARIAVAEFDRTLAVDDQRVVATELRAAVTAAYFDALTAQERVELAQGSVEVANKASGAASRRVTAGKISPVEETRSNVAAASTKLELVQANAELLAAKRRLTAMWGSTAPLAYTLAQPDAGLPPLPALDLLQAQLAAAPQLQRAGKQVQREEAQLELERRQRVPDVALTFGNKKDYEQGRSQAVVGLMIPLPVFNRNQGNVLSALRRVDLAKAQLDVERLQLQQALADAYQRSEVALTQIDAMRKEMLPAAQSALNAAVTGFELGKFSFLDVLDAQRTLFQSKAQYLSALSERHRAYAEIQRYVPLDAAGHVPTTDRIMK